MSDLEGLSKFFYLHKDGKYRVYDEYETEVASFSTEQEAKDYVADKDRDAYNEMWRRIMTHEAEICMLIVAGQLGEELTDKQKTCVLREYIYQTTACNVYDARKMKKVIKRIKRITNA